MELVITISYLQICIIGSEKEELVEAVFTIVIRPKGDIKIYKSFKKSGKIGVKSG